MGSLVRRRAPQALSFPSLFLTEDHRRLSIRGLTVSTAEDAVINLQVSVDWSGTTKD